MGNAIKVFTGLRKLFLLIDGKRKGLVGRPIGLSLWFKGIQWSTELNLVNLR